MDLEHAAFMDFFRSLAASPSRRSIARAVAGLALAGPLSALSIPEDTEAKKKKRKKKKCAKAGQTPKQKKRCCRGLAKDAAGRCNLPCDVCQPAGACAFDTVQAAIDATPHLSTIRICPGIYVGDLTIPRSLTLIGAGDGISDGADTILEGTGNGSVVGVAGGDIEVTLQRLRIRGGDVAVGGGGAGGGAHNLSNLTLIDSTVTGNTADFGGGIHNDGGTVTLTTSTVIGNIAGNRGGGIYNLRGTVTLDAASRVLLNDADTNNPDSGGGIHNEQGTVTLSSPDNVTDNFPDQCGGYAVPLCSG